MGLTTKEISSSSFNDMISSVDRRSEYVENRAGANVRLNNFLTPYTLDDKSSILNAPCGYSNGVYPSLRPTSFTSLQPTFYNTNGWSWDGSILLGSPATGNTSFVNNIFLNKKNFIITFKVLTYVSGDLGYRFGGGAVNFNYFDSELIEGNIITLKVNSDATVNNFQFLTNSFNGSLSDITFKQLPAGDFTFTRGSAATRVTKDGLIKNVQILSGELVQNGDFSQIGDELVVNGDFSDGSTGWNTSNNAVDIINNEIVFNGTGSGGNIYTYKVVDTLLNKKYKISYEVVSISSGNVRIGLGGTVTDRDSTVGVHSFIVERTNTDKLFYVGGNNSFVGSIDNVSIKDVGQNWSLEGGWSVEDGLLVNDGTGVNLSATQSGFFTVGNKYRVSLDIKSITQGSLEIYLGFPQSDVKTINSIGSYTYDIIASGNTTFYIKPLNNFIGSIDNISVIEITDDTDLPRIDYTDGTGSLLLEPQSTNLQLRSQEFDNPVWNAQRATLSANDAISPDGTLNAYKLTHTSGSSGYVFDTIPTVNSGDSRLISVFAKYIDDEVFKIVTFTDSGNAVFNLLNGTVTSVGGTITDAKIENYGNGWYRCSCKYTATTTATRNYGFYLDDTSKEGVHIWGAQVEAENNLGYNGEYATSYIHTEGSTVTRNADVCNNAGSSDLINSTEGVLYAEISALADDGTERNLSLSDSSTTNRLELKISAGGNLKARFDSAFSDITLTETEFNPSNFNKIALVWSSGRCALFLNGVKEQEDLTFNTFSNNVLFNLSFYSPYLGGSNNFYGNVRSVAVFKEALTDEELAKITSTTQQEAFYEMRDKMLQIDADYYEFGDYTTRLKKLF